ncbi:D-alanyl-D-alanine carboxypeptidase family protein [Spongisporangium articulatum]|uniref:D-alanyl-D-alanine carboxypeptidase family protein n=1 Tax=Spongisporangium articulatum TaxID=3362603 RepID=A0ABW8AUQ3_9ACTN
MPSHRADASSGHGRPIPSANFGPRPANLAPRTRDLLQTGTRPAPRPAAQPARQPMTRREQRAIETGRLPRVDLRTDPRAPQPASRRPESRQERPDQRQDQRQDRRPQSRQSGRPERQRTQPGPVPPNPYSYPAFPGPARPVGTRRSARRPEQAQRPQGRRTPNLALSGRQAGIAGVLGIATIAAPISGAMAGPAAKTALNPMTSVTSSTGVEALSVVPSTTLSSDGGLLAAPSTVIVSRASRSGERSVLPGCDGKNHAKGARNGQLPSSALCTLWDGRYKLRGDAAVALAKMNVAYKRHFGENICLNSAYRSYSQQAALRAQKPGLAAPAGTSNHGWGLAVDLCDGVEKGYGSRFQWLRENAGAYGFANPDWARSGGSGPYEPWHWEYVAGE